MKRVIIETPYAADTQAEVDVNISYARAAVADSLKRGEAPYASHLFYTQPGLLDDRIPEERARGIEAGLLWGEAAELTVVYADRGLSQGMIYGLKRAVKAKRDIEIRSLPSWKDSRSAEVVSQIMKLDLLAGD